MTHKIVKATNESLKKKAFAIREEVFVKEQQVPAREEFDEFEETSHHFVALDEANEPIGSARWRQTEKGVKLERFTAKKGVRGQGIGSSLVAAVLADVRQHYKAGTYLYMHAQIDAVPLYEKFDFEKQGPPFTECEIIHYLMSKNL